MAEPRLDVVEQRLLLSDLVEQILLLLDVEDLIRCKSVCTSWQSLISSPRFVKAQLSKAYMHDRNNRELGHRRICLPGITMEDSWFYFNRNHIVGSCNGLLCVSPNKAKLVVTNPSTREHRMLPTPPYDPDTDKIGMIRILLCWGFGYDSFADDYKVIAGFKKNHDSKQTLFHMLTLKSNTWKVIGQVNYSAHRGRSGILCGGVLHWFMTRKIYHLVIISLDLSTEKFKEIPLPGADVLYDCDYDNHRLGVIEECLCIYSVRSRSSLSTKKRVMKNKWELYVDNHCGAKYDVAHCLPTTWDPHMTSSDCVDDGSRVPVNGDYIRASVFVKSLVSPHPHV